MQSIEILTTRVFMWHFACAWLLICMRVGNRRDLNTRGKHACHVCIISMHACESVTHVHALSCAYVDKEKKKSIYDMVQNRTIVLGNVYRNWRGIMNFYYWSLSFVWLLYVSLSTLPLCSPATTPFDRLREGCPRSPLIFGFRRQSFDTSGSLAACKSRRPVIYWQ